MSSKYEHPWAVLTSIVVGSAAFVAVAAATGLWVLTAAPIGFLFGFFLEKSDLCGSSALSEVIMLKDTRKLEGLWVVIATSMVVFALGQALGWIHLSPKPLIWANDLVGGVVFGVGMVLAGGCVSGTLFKAGQGNLNSLAALVAIPTGVSAVAYGPLHGFAKSLKQHVVTSADGSAVTLPSLTGLPYWLLALIIGAATLAVGLVVRKRRLVKAAPPASSTKSGHESLMKRVLTRPWKPWQSGLAIGVLALAAYVSSAASGRNYPLGVTHGVLDVQVLATDYPVHGVYKKPTPRADAQKVAPAAGAHQHQKHVVWWLVVLVVFLVFGSFVSARLRGRFSLKPKPPDEMLVAFLGGLLVGAGAAIAGGCMVGNVMSGIALMSVGNMIFFVVVVLANWATTRLYMMGPGR